MSLRAYTKWTKEDYKQDQLKKTITTKQQKKTEGGNLIFALLSSLKTDKITDYIGVTGFVTE